MTRFFVMSDPHFGQESFHIPSRKFYDTMRPNHSDPSTWSQEYIENHNSVVPKNDSVLYVLGDIARNITEAEKVFPLLNGSTKYLVMGNHDSHYPTFRLQNLFDKLLGVNYIFKKTFILSHVPVHPQELSGMVNLHGHLHKNYVSIIGSKEVDTRYVNCCIDFPRNNLSPLEIFKDGTITKKDK